MIVYTRRIVSLLALGLLASCGVGSDELGLAKSAHVSIPCELKGFTPGYWCGGDVPGGRIDPQQCVDFGFPDCATLCQCFESATADKGVYNPSCRPFLCEGTAASGMTDVLQKFWYAFQLASEMQHGFVVEFACPGAGCTVDGGNLCNATDVQNILTSCNRTTQETLKNCLDKILTTGGTPLQCAFP